MSSSEKKEQREQKLPGAKEAAESLVPEQKASGPVAGKALGTGLLLAPRQE